MPSEQSQSQSHTQSQTRPPLSHRSTSGSDSPYGGSPHGKATSSKLQVHKHHVGRGHARVPSSKALHKSTGSKVHIARDDSNVDLKKLARNSSATSLKKNASTVSLKRNKSAADVTRRPKSSQSQKRSSVHFEIGRDLDQDPDVEQNEDWEDSQSASPALSRAASSGKASRNTTAPQSPSQMSSEINTPTTAQSEERQQTRIPSADAKAITQRLLQRTPSHNTTKMSLATATPTPATHHSSNSQSPEKSQQSSMPDSAAKMGSSNGEVVSRFVGGSGTPNENSSFLHSRRRGSSPRRAANDGVKRAQSMANLTHADSDNEDDDESALAPRSRKSSTTHTYVPPQQSRTQQKLWLQRASSNIEPQQMAPSFSSGSSTLVGAGSGYDGRDPRIKNQLERTGLEYLVVRRYQDPVGKAVKRLNQLPGADKNRRIPAQNGTTLKNSGNGIGRAGHGLSQSISQSRNGNGSTQTQTQLSTAGSSYEAPPVGSQDDASIRGRNDGDDGVGAILRSMWDKSYEMSASAD